MRFVHPGWLWLLLLLPAAFWGFKRDLSLRQARFARFAGQPLWERIAPELDWAARLRKAVALLAATAFLLIALARPQWGKHEEKVTVAGLDVLVALDVSNSMEVEDVVPSRMKKAKHVLRTLGQRLEGDRIGLLAFAGSAYLACPLTTDLGYVNETLDILNPKMVVNQGTDIGIALETAKRALDRGAEEAATPAAPSAMAEKPSDSPATKVVVLVTDGEDHEGAAAEAARKLKDADIRLFILGVGTEKGGPIPVRDDQGQLHGYKRDRSGTAIVSTFDATTLKAVAAASGGKYWEVSENETEIDEIIKEMGGLTRADHTERKFVVYQDRFQVPLFFGLLLLILELSIPARKIVRKQAQLAPAQSRAVSGRPGPSRLRKVTAVLLAALGLAFAPRAARAADRSTGLEEYLRNRKGLDAFKNGKLGDAKQSFGAAQALDPTRPELQFNQGVVQAQEGDMENSIRGFADAAQGAMSRGDQALAGRSLFNLGNGLGKKSDFQNALKSYLGAIAAAKASGDKKLEEDARKNLQILQRERQKQKQQQQSGKQKQDQSGKQDQQPQDQQDQQKDQQQKQQQDSQGDKKKQPQQFKDESQYARNKEFKSEKLSKEDADRVMAELSSKEKELQARMKKQKGNPQSPGKDW